MDSHDAATQALAAARAAEAEARSAGRPYAIALALTRAGHALLVLGRPEEALPAFDDALGFIDLVRIDGEHERLRLLSMASLSLAPPDESLGDLEGLEAWIRVGRAGALAHLGRTEAARRAVDEATPMVRGWRRRDLRRALEQVAQTLDGGAAEPAGDASDDRLERATALVEAGDLDAGMREALLLIRDSEDDPAEAARARQVLGAALALAGRDDEADATLRLAFDAFVGLQDHPAILTTAPGLAERLLDSGRPADAITVIEAALDSARMRSDSGVESDLLSALGVARDDMGESPAAARAFAAAVETAERSGDALRAADARHGQAVVLAGTGGTDDAVDALSLLESARASYEAAGFALRSAGCQHEAAALLGRLGSFDAAAGRYATAADAYRAVEAADPDEAQFLADALADCEHNLALLAADPSTREGRDDAFGSGGHRMSFGVGIRG